MSKLVRSLNHNQDIDVEEKDAPGSQTSIVEVGEVTQLSLWRKVTLLGMEMRGVEPVPIEERLDKIGVNIFTMWWSISLTLLA